MPHSPSTAMDESAARATGLRLLREDGWIKVRVGHTTPDEVVLCTAL